MKRYDGWDGILDDDELILWQGRPDSRFRVRLIQIPLILFGAVFSGIAYFWMTMASQAGGYFWMFGLLHFSAGIAVGLGPVVIDNIKRKNSWYTLTGRRAFIATDLPFLGRRLQSYPITSSTPVDYRNDSPPSIFFAEEYKRTKKGPHRVAIGFIGIKDAPDVMRLIETMKNAEDTGSTPMAEKGRPV